MNAALSPNNARPAALFAFAVAAVYLCLALLSRQEALSLPLEQIQIVAFPILVLAFVIARRVTRVPLGVLLIGGLLGLTAIWFSNTYVGSGRGSFFVARLRDDPYEIDSRIFREDIKRQLRTEAEALRVKTVRYHAALASTRDAADLLDRLHAPLPLVWGSRFWVNVSFPKERSVLFPVEELKQWSDITGLRVAASVPWFGLSMKPGNDTARFLSLLFLGALGGEPAAMLRDPALFGRSETYLRTAGGINAGWRSFAHRAYPYWLLGNLHLAQALQGGKFERGELSCAVREYGRARSLLKMQDNPPLYAAILNNRGFAHWIRGIVDRRKDLRIQAVREFRAAGATMRHRTKLALPLDAPAIALENIHEIRRRGSMPKRLKKGPAVNPSKRKRR